MSTLTQWLTLGVLAAPAVAVIATLERMRSQDDG
jgi:hypothetical protein